MRRTSLLGLALLLLFGVGLSLSSSPAQAGGYMYKYSICADGFDNPPGYNGTIGPRFGGPVSGHLGEDDAQGSPAFFPGFGFNYYLASSDAGNVTGRPSVVREGTAQTSFPRNGVPSDFNVSALGLNTCLDPPSPSTQPADQIISRSWGVTLQCDTQWPDYGDGFQLSDYPDNDPLSRKDYVSTPPYRWSIDEQNRPATAGVGAFWYREDPINPFFAFCQGNGRDSYSGGGVQTGVGVAPTGLDLVHVTNSDFSVGHATTKAGRCAPMGNDAPGPEAPGCRPGFRNLNIEYWSYTKVLSRTGASFVPAGCFNQLQSSQSSNIGIGKNYVPNPTYNNESRCEDRDGYEGDAWDLTRQTDGEPKHIKSILSCHPDRSDGTDIRTAYNRTQRCWQHEHYTGWPASSGDFGKYGDQCQIRSGNSVCVKQLATQNYSGRYRFVGGYLIYEDYLSPEVGIGDTNPSPGSIAGQRPGVIGGGGGAPYNQSNSLLFCDNCWVSGTQQGAYSTADANSGVAISGLRVDTNPADPGVSSVLTAGADVGGLSPYSTQANGTGGTYVAPSGGGLSNCGPANFSRIPVSTSGLPAYASPDPCPKNTSESVATGFSEADHTVEVIAADAAGRPNYATGRGQYRRNDATFVGDTIGSNGPRHIRSLKVDNTPPSLSIVTPAGSPGPTSDQAAAPGECNILSPHISSAGGPSDRGPVSHAGSQWFRGRINVRGSLCDPRSGIIWSEVQMRVRNAGGSITQNWTQSYLPGRQAVTSPALSGTPSGLSLAWATSYDTNAYSEGSYLQFRVRGQDLAGNLSGFMESEEIRIDNTPPNIRINAYPQPTMKQPDGAGGPRLGPTPNDPSPAGSAATDTGAWLSNNRWTNRSRVRTEWVITNSATGVPLKPTASWYDYTDGNPVGPDSPTPCTVTRTINPPLIGMTDNVNNPSGGNGNHCGQGLHDWRIHAEDLLDNADEMNTLWRFDDIDPDNPTNITHTDASGSPTNPGVYKPTRNDFYVRITNGALFGSGTTRSSPLEVTKYRTNDGAASHDPFQTLTDGNASSRYDEIKNGVGYGPPPGACSTAGGSCVFQVRPQSVPDTTGQYNVKVWHRDEAGNEDEEQNDVTTLLYNNSCKVDVSGN